MKNIYDEFKHLWPGSRQAALQPSLSQIKCFDFPEEMAQIRNYDRKKTVVLYTEKNKNIVSLLTNGFEHIVCRDREDFAQELLATALMALKPQTFLENPLPFFFNGFDPSSAGAADKDSNLTLMVNSTDQKDDVMTKLRDFWAKKPEILALEDLCLQIADEMFSNIFFNAPVAISGTRPFKEMNRTTSITLPGKFQAKMFSCFSEQKVIVGCEDPFGSVPRESVIYRLESIYTEAMTAPRENTSGAGLGLKLLIDNSANFYLYSEKGKKTIFACGLILKGLKSNLTAKKHLHFVVS